MVIRNRKQNDCGKAFLIYVMSSLVMPPQLTSPKPSNQNHFSVLLYRYLYTQVTKSEKVAEFNN